ncbi:Sexual differentiation process protein ISP4 [Phaffia rhodozyma]|uniref:Sexual differentiation process protein ISP4 n=1 Tax=Phaffia rhodozyma TaxID=264483 RepID=A0A0F7SHM1_PHARH|nr:Sexual differentiation process protein ISP4 [Phaffia rhodozyma]
MLAQRLASRTVMSGERSVGTQTSLSFETSSSIRNEYLAYMEEQDLLEEEEGEGREGESDKGLNGSWIRQSNLSLDELREIHKSHLLDPNYDDSILLRERSALNRWQTSADANSDGVNPEYSLSTLPSGLNWSSSSSRREGEGVSNFSGDDVYTDYGFGEGEEDSVYAEVRAAVSNTDDPTMPVNTIRVWLLGSVGCVVLSGINQFFYFRYPTVTVSALVIQLISYPLGLLMAKLIPSNNSFLNPGPFNIKEHTLITVMAGVAQQTAYATNIITVQRYFYNQVWSFAYQIMLVLSTQLIGFSMGGLLRRFLVYPAAMIWPAALVNTALLNTLHSMSSGGGSYSGSLARDKFFFRAMFLMFLWSWFPSYIFTALSTFDWVTWIVKDNTVVDQIFGFDYGLGLSLLTFDWGIISTIGNPLAMPWWAAANMVFGFGSILCILYPALYYTGAWDAWYLPMVGSGSYDNTATRYNISRILTTDAGFNETAYHEYSQIYLPITFTMAYAVNFAGLTATLVHTFLYYRKTIREQACRSLADETDIHARLMRRYKEVPHLWYLATLVINFSLACGAILGWETHMPFETLILALVIVAVFALPVGIVQAITNQQVALNVISELIIGYIAPGRPISMMIFKTYSYISLSQGINFVSDMKMGHYMKVPPRMMFFAQIHATILAALVQVGVGQWLFTNVPGMCTSSHRKSRTSSTAQFSCLPSEVFGTSSVIWGLVGPARQFSYGKVYHPIIWGFFVGALAPFPFYYLAKRNPNKWYKFVNWPVVFSTTALVPPYLPINVSSFCYTNFLFQYVARKYYFAWWSRYNYILSAALSAGYALAAIVIFFALSFPKDGKVGENTIQTWWGNTVYDKSHPAYKILKDGQRFGPESWT